jgi:muramoyltetrapeptide carboxypeptidase
MTEARPLIRPRALSRETAIGICAPAGPVDEEQLELGLSWLERESIPICCAPHLRDRHGYLGGRDEDRLSDLQGLLDDPQVGAILFARGGYGVGRILPQLDAARLRESRKLFIGYSDFTALSLFLRERAGLASIHGPMLERADTSELARGRLLAMARGEAASFEPITGRALRGGVAPGPLVGGNLKVVAATLGTPWEIDTRGAILFLEEVGEQPYAIDRALVQLRDAGKLAVAAGVAVGRLVSCESERYPEVSADDVLSRALLPEVDGPVVVDLPFGHVADNRALGVGVRAELSGDRGCLALLDPVVEDLD